MIAHLSEATPLSATSAELGLGLGLGLGLDSLAHFSSHALPFFSPLGPPFTPYPFSPRSLVCGGQTGPHKPRLVVSHITCSPLSSSPHAHSFVLGTVVINNNPSVHRNRLTNILHDSKIQGKVWRLFTSTHHLVQMGIYFIYH